jgi:hypothetical protein
MKTHNGILIDVLYAPELAVYLVAVSKMTSIGWRVAFSKDSCTIQHGEGKIVAQATKEGNVYRLDAGTVEGQ